MTSAAFPANCNNLIDGIDLFFKIYYNILEELKLGGIGNGLVKILSSVYRMIISMSNKIFHTKTIIDAFKAHNLLPSIITYVKNHSIKLNDFCSNFENILNAISDFYVNKKFKNNFTIINEVKH